jgi:hypothetical protein
VIGVHDEDDRFFARHVALEVRDSSSLATLEDVFVASVVVLGLAVCGGG